MSKFEVDFAQETYPEEECADDRPIPRVLLARDQEVSRRLQRDALLPVQDE